MPFSFANKTVRLKWRRILLCLGLLGTSILSTGQTTSSTPTSAQQAEPVPVPQWQTAAGGKLEFDVASVRPSAPGTPYSTTVNLVDGDGASTGNLFRANAPVHAYLLFAYKISDSNQARGIYDKLPAWARAPQFFYIEARADGTPTRDQLRLMVQSLLADRFKLAIHREMQLREEYIFVLDKPGKLGPQLLPHPPEQPCVNDPSKPFVIRAPAKDTETPRYCGLVTWHIDGQQHLRMIDVTMAEMVSHLSGLSGTPTPHSGVDNTGLTGRFDVDLQFTPETQGPGNTLDDSGPTFTEALKKQLGLKLIERKMPVEILVIDHLEKPSLN
jgi:uncharacterized protein (TIGR03435 family)